MLFNHLKRKNIIFENKNTKNNNRYDFTDNVDDISDLLDIHYMYNEKKSKKIMNRLRKN